MTKLPFFSGSCIQFLKNNLRIYVFLILLSSSSYIAFAQSGITIKGKIFDEKQTSVIGATVTIKGSTIGSLTDTNGDFKFTTNRTLPITLEVRAVGYKSQEIDVYENEPVTITLSDLSNRLNEVVVVGYGTQKREDLTGAIASVQVSQLQEAAPTSFVDALQGLASGVQVSSSSGAPGATSTVRIRGGNSITGGNEPLYVIDGFPIYNDNTSVDAGALFGAATVTAGTTNGNDPLSNINPGDIESIEVLKDASATAIYGSRGANGVIIVTTKKGSKGAPKITYDASYGLQTTSHKIDLLNAQQFAIYQDDAGVSNYTPAQINAFAKSSTDWQNAAFRTAPVQNHQVSISGGNDKTQYSASLSYLNQEGIVINTDFQRYTGRVALNSKLSKNFNLGINLNESYSTANVASASTILDILEMPPTVPVYSSPGVYTYQDPYSTIGNPIAYLNNTTNQSIVQRTLGSAFGEYEIIEGLKAKVLVGIDLLDNRQYSYIPQTLYEGSSTVGDAAIGSKYTTNWLNENTITYTKTINESHNFDFLVGFTQQQSETTGTLTNGYGFVNDILGYNNLASATSKSITSSYTAWTLQSYLSRLTYNYQHKYFFTGSLREDGSSRLGANNRWGYFPSGSFGWQADKEIFLKNIVENLKLSNAKIRLSYGRTGNTEIPSYQSLGLLSSVVYPNGSGTTNTGFQETQVANPSLKWETTDQYDGGIDLGFINQRIKFTADLYYKKTYNLLLDTYVPYTSGYSVALENIGSVQNKGYDLNLTTENLKGALNWTTDVTFSVNRNKVLSLGNGVNQIIVGGGTQVGSIIKVGQPLGEFYGMKTDGLYTSASQIPAVSLLGASTKVGDVRYVDVNGDGQITTAGDQTEIGNPQPKFIFGFTNTFNYKDFDLSIFIQGSYGNQIYSEVLRTLQTPNGSINSIAGFADHYTSTNTSATYEVPNTAINNQTNSDLYVYNGSYIRLKTVTFGYTVPKKILSKIKIEKIRIYVSSQNLYTLTKYPGFDPDVNSYTQNATRQGVDLGQYPSAKSIVGGVNITF